jgi:hypothetical protein
MRKKQSPEVLGFLKSEFRGEKAAESTGWSRWEV